MAQNKQIGKLIVAVILVVAMIIMMTNTIVKIKRTRSRRRPQAVQEAAPVISGGQPASVVVAEEKDKQPTWGDDPFTGKPIRSGFGKTSLFKLSGIAPDSSNPEKSHAIIDNVIVKVGDVIGEEGMQVKEINKQEVILSNGTKEMILRF